MFELTSKSLGFRLAHLLCMLITFAEENIFFIAVISVLL